MNRRIFLKSVLQTISALLALGNAKVLAAVDQSPQEASRDWIVAYFTDLESARRIGEQYLKMHPETADINYLLKQLNLNLHHDEIAGLSRASVQNRVQGDFDSGNMISLQGWMLARTEVLLCALAAL